MPIGKHYDLDTDATLANNSDNTIASQKATKAYIDNNYIPATAIEEAATVAKTGDYNDLINKPTIPTVNNAVLTIQKNSATISTFSANASSNVTCNIAVPTKVSELTNDSGYTTNAGTVTSVQVQAGTGLSSSTSTAQSTTLNTTISIASGYKLPTTTEWNNKQDVLPAQSGNDGKFLTTNGSTMSWAEIPNGTVELAEGTNIDNIRQEGKFFIKNPTGTLPSLSTSYGYNTLWCIITQEKAYDNTYGGTYWYVQVAKFAWLNTLGVNNISQWEVHERQITDYTYFDSSWHRMDNLVEKVKDISISSDNSTYTLNLITESSDQYLAVLRIGYVSSYGFRTLTSLTLEGSANRNIIVYFKTSTTSFTLTVDDYTSISLRNANLLTNYVFKLSTMYKLAFNGNFVSISEVEKVPVTNITVNGVSAVDSSGNATITLPTVNDAVLTIQQNGTTVTTFSANASSAATANIGTTIVKFRDWSEN